LQLRYFIGGLFVWLLTLLSLVGISKLHASTLPDGPIAPHYADNVRHYDTSDGLPQNSVNAIMQSHDGYVWLGTYGGLTRFDGTRFTLFRSLAEQGPSSDRILSLLEDKKQRLWIGTEDAGVSMLAGSTFVRLDLCEGRCRTAGLVLTDTGILAVTSVGLFAISGDTLSATRIGPELPLEFAATHAGHHYAAGPAGLWRVRKDRLTDSLQSIPAPAGKAWTRPSLLTVVDDSVILGLADNLYRMSDTGWQVFDERQKLPGTTAAVRDPAGKLWLSDIAGRAQYQFRTGEPFVPSLMDGGAFSSQ